MCVQLDYITSYANSHATMRTKLCNLVVMHVPTKTTMCDYADQIVQLCCHACATAPTKVCNFAAGVRISHDNSYATMRSRLCNCVTMHVPIKTTICATITTVDANKKW